MSNEVVHKQIEVTDSQAKELREKYRLERDKRLRQDGNAQYIELTEDQSLGRYLQDPYSPEFVARPPLTDTMEVVIIGGGFGGLLAAVRLREKGLKDIRIIERASDFGGTWYWNRYPGAACDIESYVYLPLLEETGYMPVQKYSKATEIFSHAKNIAKKYDLYQDACLQTEVEKVEWDGVAKAWTISTNRGDKMRARHLIVANGPMNRPKLPDIPGVESFAGHSFHTSRWDYAYTGGNREGGLVNLRDKRVGIIGTGATAVQCVPHLAEWSKELYVFQRTPSSIDVRGDRDTDPDWAKSLQAGWHRRRMENFNNLVSGRYEPEDLVNDGWTDIIRNLIFAAAQSGIKDLSEQERHKLVEKADFMKMEQIRARVDSIVNSAQTASALKPWYRQFCKRPCFHDEYLESFNRANTELVDTDGKGIEAINPLGVVANNSQYDLDCLIFATGFSVGTGLSSESIYPIYGKDGKWLQKEWQEGVETFQGITVRGYPNLFILGGPQGGFTANYPHNLDEQSTHIAFIIDALRKTNKNEVQPSESAVADWVEEIITASKINAEFQSQCTPGYYNNEGQPNPLAIQASAYGAGGGGSVAYFEKLKDWRTKGNLDGLELV